MKPYRHFKPGKRDRGNLHIRPFENSRYGVVSFWTNARSWLGLLDARHAAALRFYDGVKAGV